MELNGGMVYFKVNPVIVYNPALVTQFPLKNTFFINIFR